MFGLIEANDFPHSPFLHASASPLFAMSLVTDAGTIRALASQPAVSDELTEAGKIPGGGAKPSGATRKALAIDGDIGAVLGTHWLPYPRTEQRGDRRADINGLVKPA
jgi:hypothetical protein